LYQNIKMRLIKYILGLTLIATSTFSQNNEDAKISVHIQFNVTDDVPDIEPEALDIKEDFPPKKDNKSRLLSEDTTNQEDENEDENEEVGEHRILADYPKFRMQGYYGFLQGSSMPYFRDDLFPPVLDYFSNALKVKYPLTEPLKITSDTICSLQTPSILSKGVNTDYVILIKSMTSESYVASTSVCKYATGSGRPIVAKMIVNPTYIMPTTDILLHEKNMICVMHEITHSLGFATSSYKRWIDASGKILTGHIQSATLGGATATVLTAEPLRTMLREHFACPTLKGAYMENSGSSGTAGSHFERRQFSFEYMTSGLFLEMQITKLTLGLLESTGWFVTNYEYADEFNWGKGQGCAFLTGTCSADTYSEFCSGSTRKCSVPGLSGGECKSDTRSDNCKFIHSLLSYHCQNPDAKKYASAPALETFGRETGSKCFEGTLVSSKDSTYCFTYSCNTGNTQLTVNVGSKKAICSKKGPITVEGQKGKLNCPDPKTFCTTVGKLSCPRGCHGRGTCEKGRCS
jgi:hypothetical protein